jgi:REP element-mobilizing transposase RayT
MAIYVVILVKCSRNWPRNAQKESRIEEGHLMPDHVHMMIAIPPKYAVSQVVGYIKGKSAIHLARVYADNTGVQNELAILVSEAA